jgi:hypothetical protein
VVFFKVMVLEMYLALENGLWCSFSFEHDR